MLAVWKNWPLRSRRLILQWDASTASWTHVGTVTDAVGPDRKQILNGKEYDHVFQIQLDEGAPVPIGHNVTGALPFRDRGSSFCVPKQGTFLSVRYGLTHIR